MGRRNKFLLIFSLILVGNLALPSHSQNNAIENDLRSRMRYVQDGSMKPCQVSQSSLADPKSIGRLVCAVLPLKEVDYIEIQGDEVQLPAAIVLEALLIGRIAKRDPRAFGIAHSVRLHMKDHTCIEMTVFPIDHELFHQALIGGGWVELPPIPAASPKAWGATLSHLKLGISRAEVEKYVHVDGGISVPFRYERFVVNGFKMGDKVLKINAAFRPASVSQAAYDAQVFYTRAALDAQPAPKQSPNDILMRLSPIYLESPYCD